MYCSSLIHKRCRVVVVPECPINCKVDAGFGPCLLKISARLKPAPTTAQNRRYDKVCTSIIQVLAFNGIYRFPDSLLRHRERQSQVIWSNSVYEYDNKRYIQGVRTIDDLLSALIVDATPAALTAGIKPGMTGIEAVDLIA